MLSVGALTLLHCKAKAKTGGVGKIGLQLWSVRNAMNEDPIGTLKLLADIGYKDVECAGYSEGKFYGMSPMEFKKVLADLDLEMQSGHTQTGKQNPETKNTMTNGWEGALKDAAEMGQKSMILAWIAPEERDGLDKYKELVELLNTCGEKAKEYGIQMGYHNHEFEFENFDGVVAYEYMIENTDPKLVAFEMDHFWVKKGNADSVDLFNKYPGRFPYWHVKDMDDTPDAFFTEVGSGIIDWAPIFQNKEKSGMQYFYVEQDDFRGIEPLDSVKISHDYLKNFDPKV